MTVQVSGEIALDLIDIGTSAESIALGGVYSASETAHSIFQNPASLGHNINWSVDIFQTQTISDVTIQNMSLSTAYKKYSLGVGYVRTSMGGMERTTTSNVEGKVEITALGNSYDYKDEAFYLGGKVQLTEFISTGITAKLVKRQIDTYSGKGLNSDIGIMWKSPSYSIGFSAQNILRNQKMEYGSAYQDEELPLKLIMNTSKKLRFKALVSTIHFQVKHQSGHPPYYSGGQELYYRRLSSLKLLLGYRTMLHLGSQTISRQSIGLNLNIKGLKLSYAFEKSKAPIFDNMHYFSFSVSKKEMNPKKSRKSRRQKVSQSPVLVVNLENRITIKKSRIKKGISGYVKNVKELYINDTKVFIRPDNKFYVVMPLSQKRRFKFKFKAIGHNGKKVTKRVIFIRQ